MLNMCSQLWQRDGEFKIARFGISPMEDGNSISSLIKEGVLTWSAVIVTTVKMICNDMLSFVFKDNAANKV